MWLLQNKEELLLKPLSFEAYIHERLQLLKNFLAYQTKASGCSAETEKNEG